MLSQVETESFVITDEYRHFAELCDNCRRNHFVGLSYGPPGVGKTKASRRYAQWDRFEALLPDALVKQTGQSLLKGSFPRKLFDALSIPPSLEDLPGQIVFYTAPISAYGKRIEYDITGLCASMAYLWETPEQRAGKTYNVQTTFRLLHQTELVVVDEADRLNSSGLEQLRDLSDRRHFGLVLVGTPGLEKRLKRYPQLFSRIGFSKKFELLSDENVEYLLRERRRQLLPDIQAELEITSEVIDTIVRFVEGNHRHMNRLLTQIQHILQRDELRNVTKDTVEIAWKSLTIGKG